MVFIKNPGYKLKVPGKHLNDSFVLWKGEQLGFASALSHTFSVLLVWEVGILRAWEVWVYQSRIKRLI